MGKLGGALEDVLTPLLDPAFRLGTLLLGDTVEAQRRVRAVVQDIAEGAALPPAEEAPAWFLRAVYASCRPGRPVGNSHFGPLAQTIGRLPAEERAALFLHYWLQLSAAEVGSATGIPAEELSRQLELPDGFGPGVRARDVSDAIEALTEPAPYGFERQVLKAAGEAPAEPSGQRVVPPLAWAGIAALALAALLLVIFVAPRLSPKTSQKLASLTAQSLPSPAAPATATPLSQPAPSPSAAPTAAPSPSPPAVASSSCSVSVPSEPGVSQPVPVSAVRVGSDSSRDRFVVQLNGPIPPFNLKPVSGGWLLTISGASQDQSTIPTDFKTGYPMLTEARSVGGAAGSVGWSLSVSSPSSCPAVSTLSGPSRIVVDFPHA